jgi:hypothetical protein
VARDAASPDPEAERALLGAADAVQATPGVRHDLTAALVEEHVDARQVGPLAAQPDGALGAADLLVDDRDDLQRAALGPPAGPGQRGGGDGLGRGLGLHVDRSAAPQEAVVDLAAPGVVAPVLGVGEHGVDVRQVAEGGSVR